MAASEEALIGRVCHEAIRAMQAAMGEPPNPPWEEASEAQRASVCAGVRHLRGNPGARPEDQHNAWMQHKLNEGWKRGEAKDEARKEHPCLIPYEELPPLQRAKDMVFQAVVRAIRASAAEAAASTGAAS